MAAMKRWKVACEDGFEVVSSKEHELVKYVQQHVKELHNKDVSHEEVMKMAKPA
jgi:predicted small metal-binding protein